MIYVYNYLNIRKYMHITDQIRYPVLKILVFNNSRILRNRPNINLQYT